MKKDTMARETVSRTALGAAICRLIEQYQPEETRLFSDPLAGELVGAPIRWLMRLPAVRNLTVKQTDAVATGIYGAQICRTRFIDDAVRAALSRGIRQLVILGAGLDTRPYRLPGIQRVKVFEIDLPSVQDAKKKRIRNYIGRLPDHVAFIPIDFDTQSLESVLDGTAFDPSRPAIFVWEGVTQYIMEDAVTQILRFIGKCAPGSIVAFTYVLKSVIERRSAIEGADHMMDVVAKQTPWVFGLEPSRVADFLKPFHLPLTAHVGAAEYEERYLKPVNRKLAVFEGERVAEATVAR
jgi:methyltransferase (TIGR00027 family)